MQLYFHLVERLREQKWMIKKNKDIQKYIKIKQYKVKSIPVGHMRSTIWPVWLNGWVFIYELCGCGFESRCSHVNFRYDACFEQGVPWHSGKYRVWIHSETRTWNYKNIQSIVFKAEAEAFSWKRKISKKTWFYGNTASKHQKYKKIKNYK